MKLSGAEAQRFIDKPDRALAGLLIHGPDPVEVSARRARLIRNLIGEGEGADLRLTRIPATDLRRDPAMVSDAMKARGFFDGPQVVAIEDAGDGQCAVLEAALSAATTDDAFLTVTAGVLKKSSRLRKLFEGAKNAAAAATYADRIGGADVRRLIAEENGPDVSDDAAQAIQAFGEASGAGAMRELVGRLVLYRLDDGGPIEAADVAACGGGMGAADLDGAIDAVILGRSAELGARLRRIQSQGQSAATISRVLSFRLRQLHSVLAVGGATDAAIGRLRPPVFGDRRQTLLAATRLWTLGRIEGALRLSLELEDALRGAASVSGFAIAERCFLKLALTAERSGR